MNITRRKFLKGTAALAGAALLSDKIRFVSSLGESAQGPDPIVADIKRSVCLMCHSACGIQCKIKDGVLIKIDGNPYHPNCAEGKMRVLFETNPKNVTQLGNICAKGQAGIKEVYNPLRIKHPLKRDGPRGSGKWKVITWEQAIQEIVEGGDLFGEGQVEGLRTIRDLSTPVNPDAPELGPKANQFVMMIGRAEHGRKEFTDRWVRDAYGSINYRNDHTSICETSHHVGLDLCFKGKHHIKPDIVNAEYIIFFGTSPYEANFPMQALYRKLNIFRERGGKMVIIDPRFSNSAAKADTWVPILPGSDAAFALGMMRWILDNNKHDKTYLENTTEAAGNADGHKTYTNASYLVRLDTKKFLRTEDAGLGEGEYVVVVDGVPTAHDTVDRADLDATLTVNGISCKTGFSLLRERVNERTLSEYAKICGIEPAVIENVAKGFTSHGRKATADFYRGPVQHTNGTYAARTIAILNFLIGNISWKGGCEAHGGSHWHEMGGKAGNPHDLKKSLHPGKVKATGIPIDRHRAKYEDSTEFKKNGYPAKRPWFPFAYNFNWQEVIPSIDAEYPYPTKALFILMANPVYSTPGGTAFIPTLMNTKKLPLTVSFDIYMGETSALCDYILPDRHYLERFATPHVSPAILTMTSGVRQPVIDPVHPDTMLVEDVLIKIAERMNLPGYGNNGFGENDPLNTAEDWYTKLFENIAFGDKENNAVPGATAAEKVAYIRDRGGRFENVDKEYNGEYTNHPYKGICYIYHEGLASSTDSMTGALYDGLPIYEPIKDIMGNLVEDPEYDLHLITHKLVFHTQSRTASNPWLMELLKENHAQINTIDADSRGIKTGDNVKVSSATNPAGVYGKALVTESIRPGIVTIPNSYGHWEAGSKSHSIDGKKTKRVPYIGKGLTGNPIMRLDPYLKDVTLQDPIGGSASFFDTKIKIEKV